MVLGFHFIFSAYGFWLPNDPRGSWSDTVRSFDLLRFGPAKRPNTAASVAHVPHNHDLRNAAKQELRYPPVQFTGHQARAIARGISTAAATHQYIIYALTIMPDHIHLVMAAHPRPIDQISAHLKAKATTRMTHRNPTWPALAEGGLNSAREILFFVHVPNR